MFEEEEELGCGEASSGGVEYVSTHFDIDLEVFDLE
jgi:hypothetical protein